MKIIYKYAMIASAVLSLAACNDLIESSEPAVDIERAIILTATREGTNPNTRSFRMDDGTTWWGPKEEISVFYGSGSNGGSKFTSSNTTLAETTEFEGSISMSGNKEFWAVYPYSADNSCDGSSIITVIPSQQTGVEGNFSNDAFPAMGKSGSLTMPFYNICGGIKFFVSRADIKSVTFKGNNGEVLAGKVKVTFGADGKPEVAEVIEGQTEVTLTAPDGGTFKAGKYYYVTLLPGLLDGEFTMTFTTASETGTLKSDKQQTIKRSVFGTLKSIDSKVAEWESNVVEPEYVDLGLPSGLKWATFNVGATKPEEYGGLFAWGETTPRPAASFTQYWNAYKWCNGSKDRITKYCIDSSFWGSSYPMDNKTVLDLEDDAARANWGNSWRMPTDEEWNELIENCTWTWTSNYNGTGVAGGIVTSNKPGYTDKSIFLPCPILNDDLYKDLGYTPATLGLYWSSSLSLQPQSSQLAYCLAFDSSQVLEDCLNRFAGFPVRPVYGEFIPVAFITLNESSLNLIVNSSAQLVATITPSNATEPSVRWVSADKSIVTVDGTGNVTAVAEGTTTVSAYASNGLSASCVVTVSKPIPEPEAVDLGLPSGIKWATFNVGATKPEEYGDYFAWGETEPKWDYDWSTYKFELGTDYNGPFSKYVTNSSYGTVDNKTVLDPEDDAAHVNWGGSWRMPTDTEWAELINTCTLTWTGDYNGTGVAGIIVTSNISGYTDKSIFLPAAGRRNGARLNGAGSNGRYWSSSLISDLPYGACGVNFLSGDVGMGSGGRYCGRSVRPVSE